MVLKTRPYRPNHTNEEDRILDIYLQEASKTPLLDQEEEQRLAKQLRLGNETKREKLIKANLRFVISVAKNYQNRGISLADLISAGNLGLIKATKRFDERKGFRFISYAVWWIKQAILQEIAEQGRIVRLPQNRLAVLGKVKKAEFKLTSDFESEVDSFEISQQIGIDESEVEEARMFFYSHLSIDQPLGESEGSALTDILEDKKSVQPDAELLRESDRLVVEKALDTLRPREAEFITLYFGLKGEKALTLEEIGQRFNLTRERVRQIKEKAIRRLRHSSRSHDLRQLLPGGKSVSRKRSFNYPTSQKQTKPVKRRLVRKPKIQVIISPVQVLAKKSVKIPAITFSRLSHLEVNDWITSLREAILALAPQRSASLCSYYGLFDSRPLTSEALAEHQINIFSEKEYALLDLARATDIAYCKLRRLMERNREIREAH